MSRLHPFVPLVAALAAAASALLGLQPLLALVTVGTCALFASALRPPWEPEPAPVPPPPAAPESKGPPPPVPEGVRPFLESLPGALIVIGEGGRVTYANAAATAALPTLALDRHHAHVIRAPAFVEAVAGVMADGQPRSVDVVLHQGTERVLEAQLARLQGEAGGEAAAGAPPQGVVVLLEDRTRSRRAEELRSDFIANASHELRTPLASIVGYVETLQNHARDDPEARQKFLGIMAREAARMQRLVDDLMSLSRIEMNEHVRPVEQLPLRAVVSECISALQPIARQKGLAIHGSFDPDAPGARVLGDRDQLMQVFTNLIDNALKYGGTDVTVTEVLPATGGRIGVTVADSGPGIAREHLPRLTERFYRVSVGQSRSRGGTGLGLAIVKHILNRHLGRLEVTSEPGGGSVFTVWLPLADRTEAGGVRDARDR